MANFIETEKEASKGGFQGIKTVRGLVTNVDKVPPPPTWQSNQDQIQVSLTDATVIEMFDPAEDIFELKEGKFNFMYPYAEPGKKPSNVSAYILCLVKSAAAVGKKPTELIGTVQTFSKIPINAFQRTNQQTKEKEWVVYDKYFSVVPDQGSTSDATKNYIRELLTKDGGLNQSAALRALIVDERAKQFPEYQDMLQKGTLAETLGLKVVDGKFTK